MNTYDHDERRNAPPKENSGAHGYYRDSRYDWQRTLKQQEERNHTQSHTAAEASRHMHSHARADTQGRTNSSPQAGSGYRSNSGYHSNSGYRSASGYSSGSGYRSANGYSSNSGYRSGSRYAEQERTQSRKKQGVGNRHTKSRRTGGFRHAIAVFLRIVLCLLLTVCIVGGIWGYVTVSRIIKEAPELTAAAVTPAEAASYIYDSSGNRDLKLTLPEANRDLVSIQNVPLHLQHAFVAIEDARFYKHNGIDLKGIARAFVKGAVSGHFSEGASTITQQLIKNSILTGWTSETTLQQRFRRKIQEQFLAMQLEEMMSKDQILQDYMNTINLGAGCYGIQSAAYRYFGKDVADLTLSESAAIAGITQNPTRYNPITNPENNRERRNSVLQAMLKQGYISQAEMDEALADDVYARIQSNEDPAYSTGSIYTSYQDALIDQVIEDLQTEKEFSYKQAVKAVYSGGLKIYSAQDEQIQQIVDDAMADPASFPAETKIGIDYALSLEHSDSSVTHYGNEQLRTWVRSTQGDAYASFDLLCDSEAEAENLCAGFQASVLQETDTLLGERMTLTPQPQASAVLIEQSTGYVKAISGGRGEKSASLTLNRATSSQRQPGSTFKILAAFAPAIEKWGKTLATAYANTAYNYSDGTPVSNWNLNDYSGEVTIREAITRSINVAAVRCLTEITPQTGYDMLLRFGFTTLVEGITTDSGYMTDIGQALVLGGLTNGVTNLELCAAYAAIANEGTYITPKFYTRVEDASGEVLLDQTAPAGHSVISASTAWLLTDAMRDVIEEEDGTAHGYIDTGDMPAAGKSGTTDSYKDVWFTGYTPYYTLSIWGGYDNNTPLGDDESSHEYDKVLWNSIMNRIDEELALSPVSFRKPADIINISICRDSGMVAVSGCDDYIEYFTAANQPLNYCPVHGSGLYVSRGIAETDHFSSYGENEGQTPLPSGDGDIVIYSEDSAYIPSEDAGASADAGTSADAATPAADTQDVIVPDAGNTQGGETLPQDDAAANEEEPVIVILN